MYSLSVISFRCYTSVPGYFVQETFRADVSFCPIFSFLISFYDNITPYTFS